MRAAMTDTNFLEQLATGAIPLEPDAGERSNQSAVEQACPLPGPRPRSRCAQRTSFTRDHGQPAHLDILGISRYAHSPRMPTNPPRNRLDLLQGTLDLLILRTLRQGPTHGHAIAKAIERGSDDVLLVEQGSLYPALHRLIKRGWITFGEGTSENNRRAKFYRLTAKGRKQLALETSKWDRFAGAIARILRPAEQE
jgi:transcriptional regulator